MKRVGVVTWFGGSNYGTSLQAFALCYTLQQMGVIPFLIKRYKTWRNMLGGLIRNMKMYFHDLSSYGLGAEKKQKIKSFKKENFHQFPQCFGLLGILCYKKQIASLDCVISGSDQLWNPYYTDPFLLLENFNIPKYSYASSIGVEEIPLEKKDLYKRALSSFINISVRENSAIQPLSELYERPIKKVVDPTFLLTDKQWIEFSEKSTLRINTSTPYILAYFIADNLSYWSKLNQIQRQSEIARVIVLPMQPNHLKQEGEIIDNAGIYDFVYLIRHARLVCTDSFHATAMSINLKINFITFMRFQNGERRSQNSRLVDLLQNYGLGSRLYENCGNEDLLNVDFSLAEVKLSQERNESRTYIKSIIKD